MRKKFLLLFFLTSLFSYGQIELSTEKHKKKQKDVPNDTYDNFLGTKVKDYIGKTFYLPEMRMESRRLGYSVFVTDYKKYVDRHKYKDGYECIYYKNEFHPHSDYSSYEALAEKYFLVLDVVRHPKARNESSYANNWFIKLEEIESGDVVYYLYNEELKHSFPFVMIEYYERVREEYKGKEYVLRGVNWYDYTDEMFSTNNNAKVDFSAGTIWKCVGVGIDTRTYKLSIILEDAGGEQIGYPMYSLDQGSIYSLFEKTQSDKYKEKFGDDWDLILAKKVDIGFTEEMCLLSRGTPEEKYNILDGEKWIYKYRNKRKYEFEDEYIYGYLYLEKGKLAAWDNPE